MSMPYKFENRWLIEGTLTTLGQLHIGTGDWAKRETTENWLLNKDEEPAKIAEIIRDHRNRPYIPGSTLKGCVRSWLEQHLASHGESIRKSFGFQDPGTKGKGHGGRWEFLDARMPEGVPKADEEITAQAAIDRVTRTAADDKLFHCEAVKAGAAFVVRIGGQNLDDEDVALLLEGLEAFNAEDGAITVGASGADGCWGRMRWAATGLRKLLPGEPLMEHLEKGRLAYQDLPAFPLASLQSARDAVKATETSVAKIRIGLELEFEGAFLVNDARRCKTKYDKDPNDKRPNHAPITKGGWAYLPASSFRGAFRSQAERIARTMGMPARTAAEIQASNIDEAKRLDGVSRLFGVAGWRTPVEISDFTHVAGQEKQEQQQEFVAIDRFTGGGADHLKFNAKHVLRPLFQGHMEIDLSALARADAGGWALALMAFVLRDLREGDIGFGFGSSKGYGGCRARVTSVDCRDGFDGASAEQVKALLKDGTAKAETLGWFDALQKEVRRNATA